MKTVNLFLNGTNAVVWTLLALLCPSPNPFFWLAAALFAFAFLMNIMARIRNEGARP